MSQLQKIQLLRSIMLSGAAIYLVLLSFTMSIVATKGTMLWHADFLLQHGEPILVGVFGVWCAYEVIMQIRHMDKSL